MLGKKGGKCLVHQPPCKPRLKKNGPKKRGEKNCPPDWLYVKRHNLYFINAIIKEISPLQNKLLKRPKNVGKILNLIKWSVPPKKSYGINPNQREDLKIFLPQKRVDNLQKRFKKAHK